MATMLSLADNELARRLAPGAVHTLNLLPGQGLMVHEESRITHHRGPAEIALDGVLARINRLGQPDHRYPVLWRCPAFALSFAFPALASAEYLPVSVSLGLELAIHQPEAFAERFLAGETPATTAALRNYLFDALRQTLAEDLRRRSLPAMVADAQLRPRLRTLLRSELETRLAVAGLQLVDVTVVEITHPAHDAARREQAGIHLALENEQARQAAQTQLDALYDEAQWQCIQRRELAIQQQLRERELELDEAEQKLALRQRQLNLLERVQSADTREQAIGLVGENELAALEHKLLGQRLGREGEQADWQHEQTLLEKQRQEAQRTLDDEHALLRQRRAQMLRQEQEDFRRRNALADAENEATIEAVKRQGKQAHLAGLAALDASLDRPVAFNEQELMAVMLEVMTLVQKRRVAGSTGAAAEQRLRELCRELSRVENPPAPLSEMLDLLGKLLGD